MFLHRLALALPLALLGGGCHLRIGSGHGVEVDGVRLTEHHVETLPLEAWPAEGLAIEAHVGDVVIVRADGPTTLQVEVWERAPGAAHAGVLGGRLEAHAAQGPCAIGDVTIHTPLTATGLTVATGVGDVRVHGVRLEGAATLTTGLGDIEVREVGSPTSLKLESGMGDIDARTITGAKVVAETGMGDIVLQDVAGPLAACSTGMGDIELVRCTLERVEGETGMGDIEARESSFTERELSSGMGSVRVR